MRSLVKDFIIERPISVKIETNVDPTPVLKAPVTEIFDRYFLAEDVPPIEDSVLKDTADFVNAVSSVGPNATATGWSLNTIRKDGAEQKLMIFLAGWKSMEDHAKARETKIFNEGVKLIRRHVPTSTAMVHVKFLHPN
jgi:hypothetical protein